MGFPATPQRQAATWQVKRSRGNARSHGIARFNFRDAPIFGQNRRARSGRIHRENPLDFETHGAVAAP
jgi:hypothetical protein